MQQTLLLVEEIAMATRDASSGRRRLSVRSVAHSVVVAIGFAAILLASAPAHAATGEEHGIDPDIRPYLLAPDANSVLELAPRSWGKMGPFARRLLDRTEEGGEPEALPDLLTLVLRSLRIQGTLPALDRSRSTYVIYRSRVMTPRQVFQELAIPYEALDSSSRVIPTLRFLLPTDKPEALKDEMAELLALPAVAAEAEGRWLRIEMSERVEAAASDPERSVDDMVDGVPTAPDSPRLTPAREAFLQHEGPVSFWTTLRSGMDAAVDVGDAELEQILRTSNDVGLSGFFKGVAASTSMYDFDMPEAAEFEDLALLVDGVGSDGASLDVIATPTEQGRRVWNAFDISADFPLSNLPHAAIAFRPVGSITQALAAAEKPWWAEAPSKHLSSLDLHLLWSWFAAARAPITLGWASVGFPAPLDRLRARARYRMSFLGEESGRPKTGHEITVVLPREANREIAELFRERLRKGRQQVEIYERDNGQFVLVAAEGISLPNTEPGPVKKPTPSGLHMTIEPEFLDKIDSIGGVLRGMGLSVRPYRSLIRRVDWFLGRLDGLSIRLRTRIRPKALQLRVQMGGDAFVFPELSSDVDLVQPNPRCLLRVRRQIRPILEHATARDYPAGAVATKLEAHESGIVESLETCGAKYDAPVADWGIGGYLAWRALAEARAGDNEEARELTRSACERGLEWSCDVAFGQWPFEARTPPNAEADSDTGG